MLDHQLLESTHDLAAVSMCTKILPLPSAVANSVLPPRDRWSNPRYRRRIDRRGVVAGPVESEQVLRRRIVNHAVRAGPVVGTCLMSASVFRSKIVTVLELPLLMNPRRSSGISTILCGF